jgi:lysophospholipase L1-like esterase
MKNVFQARLLRICLACFILGFIFIGIAVAEQGLQKIEANLYSSLDDFSRSEDTPSYLSLHYRLRKSYFYIEPHKVDPIVFLGDSMTDEGHWHQLFPQLNLVNRGIGGDTTTGILNRIDQVTALDPPTIFLMIGTNDLCFNRAIPDIITNYDKILGILHQRLPNTKIYVESVLPFNNHIFPSVYLRTNENIKILNVGIKRLAQTYNDPYIDLTKYFSDKDGRLPAEYTVDGLHLNEKGYAIWRDQIQKFEANEKVVNLNNNKQAAT